MARGCAPDDIYHGDILERSIMAEQIPPAYSTTAVRSSDVLPPTYSAPTQFNIGSLRTPEPLVNLSQIKGHLVLLHAFAELKKQVEELREPIPDMPADLERRWAWFVAMAVERFVSVHVPATFALHDLSIADLTFGVTDCNRRMRRRVWK